MWEEKEENKFIPKLKWKVIGKAKIRQANDKRCNLCSKETLFIMKRNSKSINSRMELGGYCPHRRVYLLDHIKSNEAELKLKQAEKKRKKQKHNKNKKSQ